MWSEVMSIFVCGLWELLQFKSALRNFSYILAKYDPLVSTYKPIRADSQKPRNFGLADICPIASIDNCTDCTDVSFLIRLQFCKRAGCIGVYKSAVLLKKIHR